MEPLHPFIKESVKLIKAFIDDVVDVNTANGGQSNTGAVMINVICSGKQFFCAVKWDANRDSKFIKERGLVRLVY